MTNRNKYVSDNALPESLYSRRLNVEYAYIVGIAATEEEPRYMVLVKKEFCLGSVSEQPAIVPMEEPPEVLAASFGRPEDLIGQRVRIEYFGSNWKTGIARIVTGRDIPSRPNLTDIPSRGFRYAVAGHVGED